MMYFIFANRNLRTVFVHEILNNKEGLTYEHLKMTSWNHLHVISLTKCSSSSRKGGLFYFLFIYFVDNMFFSLTQGASLDFVRIQVILMENKN